MFSFCCHWNVRKKNYWSVNGIVFSGWTWLEFSSVNVCLGSVFWGKYVSWVKTSNAFERYFVDTLWDWLFFSFFSFLFFWRKECFKMSLRTVSFVCLGALRIVKALLRSDFQNQTFWNGHLLWHYLAISFEIRPRLAKAGLHLLSSIYSSCFHLPSAGIWCALCLPSHLRFQQRWDPPQGFSSARAALCPLNFSSGQIVTSGDWVYTNPWYSFNIKLRKTKIEVSSGRRFQHRPGAVSATDSGPPSRCISQGIVGPLAACLLPKGTKPSEADPGRGWDRRAEAVRGLPFQSLS